MVLFTQLIAVKRRVLGRDELKSALKVKGVNEMLLCNVTSET